MKHQVKSQAKSQKRVGKFDHLRGTSLDGQRIFNVRAEQVTRAVLVGPFNPIHVQTDRHLHTILHGHKMIGFYDPRTEELLVHSSQISACVILGVNWREVVKLAVESERTDTEGASHFLNEQAESHDFGGLRGVRHGLHRLYIDPVAVYEAAVAVVAAQAPQHSA